MLLKWYIPILLGLVLCHVSFAQKKTSPVTDTAKVTPPVLPPPKPGEPKPYSEVVPSTAKSRVGLFSIHQVGDRWFVEIPDSLIGRDILVVNRIAKSAADSRAPGSMQGYAGDIINDNVVRFEKGSGYKIFLKQISFSEYSADSTVNGLYRSVVNNTVQPIAAVFEIKARGKDSCSSVLDFTDLISGDNELLFFDPRIKGELRLQQLMPDKSFINGIKTFPKNVEFITTKTFARTAGPFSAAGPATYELNSSMVLLPEISMQGRRADPRVGYFRAGYIDFDADPQSVKKTEWITRFNLEPKVEDRQRYLSGELVEPLKPIVYYIDPATPKKWVPYLIQGVNDWQVAFEQAGFKNAIYALEAPTDDSSFSIDDAIHNAIVYKPSAVPNASGPHVHDPRSGEIIETHINWYHNVMSLLKNWYTVQAGTIDPRTHTPVLPDSLMGALIRFVSSHEVGHTLGLLHNYGSSSTVPVDSLRNKKWVEKNGHTPSIMDYARFNYVAQPGDSITSAGIFPRIGDYDKWAIEYGYRWWPEESRERERQKLDQWIISKISSNPRLWFGTETDGDDPRCQNEDLGDNAMKASDYGIKNLRRIIPNIIQWSTAPGDDYNNALNLYREVIGQYSRYMGHVAKYIGGIETTPRTAGEKGTVVEWTDLRKQRRALQFLQEQLFTTPTWLLDKTIQQKTGAGSAATISGLQSPVLSRLMSPTTLYKLIRWESVEPAKCYTISAMLGDLQSGIFSELQSGKSISIFRRNLQKAYVGKLIDLMKSTTPAPAAPGMPSPDADISITDIPSIAKQKLKQLQTSVQNGLSKNMDGVSRAHLQDLRDRITIALTPKN